MKNSTKTWIQFSRNSFCINPRLSYKGYALFIMHSLDVPTFLESLQEIFKAKPSSGIDSEFIFFIHFALLQLLVNSWHKLRLV